MAKCYQLTSLPFKGLICSFSALASPSVLRDTSDSLHSRAQACALWTQAPAESRLMLREALSMLMRMNDTKKLALSVTARYEVAVRASSATRTCLLLNYKYQVIPPERTKDGIKARRRRPPTVTTQLDLQWI